MVTKLLCRMFGHKPPVYAKKGWYSPGEEYGKVVLGGVDGIKRQHARVVAGCARCHEEFTVARIHVPQPERPEYARVAKVHVDGEPNFYTLLNSDENWIASVQMNGEMLVSRQYEVLESFIGADAHWVNR